MGHNYMGHNYTKWFMFNGPERLPPWPEPSPIALGFPCDARHRLHSLPESGAAFLLLLL